MTSGITFQELWDKWKLPPYPEKNDELELITEKYFRSLYKCLIKYKGKKFDTNILINIINEAAYTQPIDFSPEWNNVYWPNYEPNGQSRNKVAKRSKALFFSLLKVFGLQSLPLTTDTEYQKASPIEDEYLQKSDYDLAVQKLQVIIADYRKMIKDYKNTPEDSKPFYIFQSDKGLRWYNFDIWFILSQSDQGMNDHLESYKSRIIPQEALNYQLIPTIIHQGIMYE